MFYHLFWQIITLYYRANMFIYYQETPEKDWEGFESPADRSLSERQMETRGKSLEGFGHPRRRTAVRSQCDREMARTLCDVFRSPPFFSRRTEGDDPVRCQKRAYSRLFRLFAEDLAAARIFPDDFFRAVHDPDCSVRLALFMEKTSFHLDHSRPSDPAVH